MKKKTEEERWYAAQDRMLAANLKRFRKGELTEAEMRRELNILVFGRADGSD